MAPSPGAPFPSNDSKSCAIVIRDGIQWGLTIISGTIPDAVRGIS